MKLQSEVKELQRKIDSSAKGSQDLNSLRDTLDKELKTMKKKNEEDLAKEKANGKEELKRATDNHARLVSQMESKIQQLNRTITQVSYEQKKPQVNLFSWSLK